MKGVDHITIQEARKAKGLTQEELAAAVGVTQGAVSQWEQGITHPNFKCLKMLSDALGITLDELVSGELAS